MTTDTDRTRESASDDDDRSENRFAETTVGRQETDFGSMSRIERLDPAQWVGKTLGKFEITRLLGQGGMGVVFKARDPLIDRNVAIKLLSPHLADDETSLQRFLAEAKAVGKLSHPNVCAIYGIYREEDLVYLVMEYVPGISFADRLESLGPCSVLESTHVLIETCRCLAVAHAAGLIHRDLKPANLLWSETDCVKVMDFGLAKVTSDTSQKLTQAGLVIGTPFYMSPEQCEARPVDVRSDIYSLGATYYSLLTAKYPYEESAGSVPRIMYNHCHGPIPDPRSSNPKIPAACAEIIARAMAKSPEERYQTVGEMLADLECVAATLSGATMISLPSQSGASHRAGESAHPGTASGTVPSVPPRRGKPGTWVAGGGAVAAILLTAIAWIWTSRHDAAPVVPWSDAEPVKIGVLHSLSGTMSSSESVVVDAMLFAVEDINRAGGVLGRPVQAVVVDGRSDPATFAREADRLITDEQVCTVFGCWTSASRKAVRQVVEEHDHLLVYPLQYEGLETSPNIIYMGAAPNQQILPTLDWAVRTLNKQKFFLIGSDYVFPRAANAMIRDHLASLGAEVVGETYLPLGSTDVQSAMETLVAARPDMILNTINGDTNLSFYRALRRSGIQSQETPCLSFSIGEQELRSLNPEHTAGDYAAWTYFESIATPENRDFVRRFHEKSPQRSITDPMESAYIGVLLWAAAVNEADRLDPKKIRRAMLNQRMIAPEGPVRIDAETQHCVKTPRIGQIRGDGQFEIVWQAAAPVVPDPYPATRTAEEWREFLHDLWSSWGHQWSGPTQE